MELQGTSSDGMMMSSGKDCDRNYLPTPLSPNYIMPIWDAILNKDEHETRQQTQADVAPNAIPTTSSEAEHRWNLDRIKDALDGRDDNERTVEGAHSQAITAALAREKEGGGWKAKVRPCQRQGPILNGSTQIADALDGDDEEKLQLELIKLEAEEKAINDMEKQLDQSQDLGDKVGLPTHLWCPQTDPISKPTAQKHVWQRRCRIREREGTNSGREGTNQACA